MGNSTVTFEIKKHIGVITEFPTGWKKEANIVSWNDSEPKLDIRDWDPEHKHMSRGITLHKDEAEVLLALLSKEFNDGK